MSLGQLLNAAYAHLVENRDEKERAKLDELLSGEPQKPRRGRPAAGGLAGLMAAANMPQAGAGAGPRHAKAG